MREPRWAKTINLTPVKIGYLFSGFSWAYVLGQLPSGGLLDRFGSKKVYGISIILWSICAFLTGFAGYLAASAAFTAIFVLRLLSGLAQAPVFPGNGRIVASWFPTAERGRASAIFNSAQYFALPDLRPHLRMDHSSLRLEELLLVHGCTWICIDVGLVHQHLRRQRASAHLAC